MSDVGADSPTTIGTEHSSSRPISEVPSFDDGKCPAEGSLAVGNPELLVQAMSAGLDDEVLSPTSPLVQALSSGLDDEVLSPMSPVACSDLSRSTPSSRPDRTLARPMPALTLAPEAPANDHHVMGKSISFPSVPPSIGSSSPSIPSESPEGRCKTVPVVVKEMQPRSQPRSQLMLPVGPPIALERLTERLQPLPPSSRVTQAERLVKEHSLRMPTWVVEEVIDFDVPVEEDASRQANSLPQYLPRQLHPYLADYVFGSWCSRSICEEDQC